MFISPIAATAATGLPNGIALQPAHAVASRTHLPCGEGAPLLEIHDGCVALVRFLPDNRRQILDILGPGRILLPLNEDNKACSAVTLTHTRVQAVTGGAHVAERICGEVNLMLRRSLDHALLLGRKTAAERVASALIDLASQFARPALYCAQPPSFRLFLTRADLADWLGLTLETVSRCLNQFKRAGLIGLSSSGNVTLLEVERLSALATGTGNAKSKPGARATVAASLSHPGQ